MISLLRSNIHYLFIVLLATVVLVCASCAANSIHSSNKQAAYKSLPTQLGNNVTETWVTDPATTSDSDEVWIILQGGPRDYLYFEKDGRTLSRYFPEYKNRHVVYLHQSQTLNPAVYARGLNFTIEEAKTEKQLTTEILDRAIKYFKSEAKKVVVIGHSYGSFIINDYLANYENLADLYLVSAVRLDVNEELVNDNLKGFTSGFKEDGISYIAFTEKNFSEYSEFERGAYHVRGLLKAAYGLPRYSQKLENSNLSNAYYVSGKSDQQVGQLTQAESAFLRNRGATVIYVDDGHSDTYKRMIDAAVEGVIPLIQ